MNTQNLQNADHIAANPAMAPSPMMMPRTISEKHELFTATKLHSDSGCSAATIAVSVSSNNGLVLVAGHLMIVDATTGEEWASMATESWDISALRSSKQLSLSKSTTDTYSRAVSAARKRLIAAVLQRLCSQVAWFSAHISPAYVSIWVPADCEGIRTPLLRRGEVEGLSTYSRKYQVKTAAAAYLAELEQNSALVARLQEREAQPIVIATDASKTGKNVAIAWVNGDWDYQSKTLANHSIDQAEILAICVAIQRHREGEHSNRRCLILTDSRAALRFFKGAKDSFGLKGTDYQIAKEAREWAKRTGIEMKWVKGHAGHKLNDAADRLAVNRKRSVQWKYSAQEIAQQERVIIENRRTRYSLNKRYCRENADDHVARYGQLMFDAVGAFSDLQEELAAMHFELSQMFTHMSEVERSAAEQVAA